MKTLAFYLGLGCILSHELDAVVQHEWRLLYVLRGLAEPLPQQLFVVIHVPLLAALLWLTHHPVTRWREVSRASLMAFLLIHVGLHGRLADHALYTFHSPLSRALILGGGLCGLVYLLLAVLPRAKR